MSLCEHGQEISQFCLTESCNWKEASGCENCMKKYHHHVGRVKLISKIELNRTLQKFQFEKNLKPHQKALQQSIISYLSDLKNQFSNCIDVIGRNIAYQLSYPYLSQTAQFKTFRKLKNQQFRRITKKEVSEFYSFANSLSNVDLTNQQQTIYHQQAEKHFQQIQSIYQGFDQFCKAVQSNRTKFHNFQTSFKRIVEINNARKINKVVQPLQKRKIQQLQVDKKDQVKANSSMNSSFNKSQTNQTNSKVQNRRPSPLQLARPKQLSIDNKVRLLSARNSYDDKEKQISQKKMKLLQLMDGKRSVQPPSKVTSHQRTISAFQQKLNTSVDQNNSLAQSMRLDHIHVRTPSFLNKNEQLNQAIPRNSIEQNGKHNVEFLGKSVDDTLPRCNSIQNHDDLFGRLKSVGINLPQLVIRHTELPEAQQKQKLYENSPDIKKMTIKVPLQTVGQQQAEPSSPLLKKRRKAQNNGDLQLKLERIDSTKQTNKAESINEPEEPSMKENQAQSLALLMKALPLAPSKAIPLLQNALKLAENNFSAAQYLSYLYLDSQRPKECLTLCNKCLDQIQNSQQERQLSRHIINNKAAALNMLGRYSESIEILQKRIIISGEDHLYKNLGDSYFGIGIYEMAIINYEEATKRNPKNDQALYNLAVCHYMQNHYNNALTILRNALKVNPKNEQYIALNKDLQEKIKFSNSLVSKFQAPNMLSNS